MSNQKFVVRAARKPLQQRMSRRCDGVTLIELIVCVSMLAILIGLAIPPFANAMSAWRRDTAVSDLMADLQLARSTAIRTSKAVVICVSADGNNCVASNDWRQSRIVFSDLNGNDARDANEPMIVQHGPVVGLLRMQSENNTNRFVFRPNGMLSSGNTTVEIQSDGAAANELVGVRINRTGRASLLALGTTMP